MLLLTCLSASTDLVLNVQGPPVDVHLRHSASGEMEQRQLAPRHAALWVGDAFEGLTRAAEGAQASDALLLCRVEFTPLTMPEALRSAVRLDGDQAQGRWN